MSSPSAALKVNYLIIRYLCFGSVRGDLQEGNGCVSRCQLPLFPVPIPVSPSTKSAFLCAFGLWNPCFRAFRAQNRGFCVRMGDFSEILGCFDTKSGFLCSGGPYRCRRPSCRRPSCRRLSCRRLSCRGRPRRRRLIWSNAARCGYCQFLVEKEASILRSTASGRL